MKRPHILACLSLFLFSATLSIAEDPACGNSPTQPPEEPPCEDGAKTGLSLDSTDCSECEQPSDPGSGGPGFTPTSPKTRVREGFSSSVCVSGCNPFSAFSGSIGRRVDDMTLAHNVGGIRLGFTRRFASRWDYPDYWTPAASDLGDGGGWRHNFQWSMAHKGSNTYGEQFVLTFPDGTVREYAKNGVGQTYFTHLANTQERVEKVTNDLFILYYPDGYRYEFSKIHITNHPFYRIEAASDPFSNRFNFAYSNGYLWRVYAPGSNQWVEYTFGQLTNSANPGVIEFTHVNASASQVYLRGSFNAVNSWDPGYAMTNSAGTWRYALMLTNGFHPYKFFVQTVTGDYWTVDTGNPISCIDSNSPPNTNSLAVIDPHRVIKSVRLTDGRCVTNTYGWLPNKDYISTTLDRVDYGDGTAAVYTYAYQENEGVDRRRPVMVTADDPHYSGPGRAIRYNYQATVFGGQIAEEVSLVTSQVLSKLIITTATYLRAVVDANGVTNKYVFTEQTGQVAVRTNSLGEVISNEFFMVTVGSSQIAGFLKTAYDEKGRSRSYSYTPEFAARTMVSNSTLGATHYSYTDVDRPFYLATITDHVGRVTTYQRDSFNRVTNTVYPDGTSVAVTYNAYGQEVTRKDAAGAVWSNEYDAVGRFIAQVGPLGNRTYRSYDSLDRMAVTSNEVGGVVRYYYNWRGSVTNTVYADGSQERIEYNSYGQVTTRTDRAGLKTVATYDALSHVQSVSNAVEGTTLYNHDAMGRLVTMTTPLGLVVSNLYDALGRKIRETFAGDGTYNEWVHDSDGVVTQRNRMGFTTSFAYTPQGWLRSVTDPLGRATSYGYDLAGNRVAETNALGDSVTATYDLMDRLVSRLNCAGAVTESNRYDAVGRLLVRFDANGHATSNQYDGAGRILAVFRNGLPLYSNLYDAAGRVTAMADGAGRVVSNAFDSMNRPIRNYMPDGTYDATFYTNGFVASQVDRAGRKTLFSRDLAGRVTAVTDNGTNTVLYRYDVAGNMTNLVDQNGRTTTWRYDTEGRQVAKAYVDGSTDSFGYDAAGRLTTKTNAGVRGVRFDYDMVGNLTNIVYPGDPAVSFSYDALDRRTRMVDGVGTTTWAHASSCLPETSADGPFAADSVAQGFDGARRLTNLVYAGLTVPYGLDALGRIVTVGGDATNAFAWLGQSFLVLTNARSAGTVTEYRYDALLHLTNVLHRLTSGATVQRFGIAYNDADERTLVTREDGHYRDYGYDPIGQLMSAQGYESGGAKRPGYGYAYAYDPAGNPLRQERNGFVTSNAFNNLNQNTTSRWSGAVAVAGAANLSNGTVTVNGVAAALRPAYDGGVLFAATNIAVSAGTNVLTAIHTDPFGRASTNRVTVVAQNAGYGFDRYGNLTNDGQFAYVWDDADRLKQVRSLSSGTTLLQCRYDGIGRRVERVEQGVTNRYVYSGPSVSSGWLVLGVLSGSNSLVETYRHGPDISGSLGGAGGIGSILSVSNVTAGVHAYHFDFNGNVTLTAAKTGAIAAVSSWIEYGPFGEILAKSGVFNPRYRFSGKEWDASVGLIYYGFRYYSPALGRWLSRDSAAESVGVNIYTFVKNSPATGVDYLGLMDCGTCDASYPSGGVRSSRSFQGSTISPKPPAPHSSPQQPSPANSSPGGPTYPPSTPPPSNGCEKPAPGTKGRIFQTLGQCMIMCMIEKKVPGYHPVGLYEVGAEIQLPPIPPWVKKGIKGGGLVKTCKDAKDCFADCRDCILTDDEAKEW